MNKFTRSLSIGLAGMVLVTVSGYGMYQLLAQQRDTAPIVSTSRPPAGAPELSVTVLNRGLDHPWDIAFLPDQTLLFTERSGTISKLVEGAKVQLEQPDDVQANGEGGMLGLAVDPDFTKNKFLYACFNSDEGDVRVVRWTMNESATALSERNDIVSDIPANPSGRHSGCRIDFGPDGHLWIATGDAALDTTPQSLNSLGGKILRVDREGKAVEGNIATGDSRIFSYGHRNTQGLAFFSEPLNGVYGYSAEHGPDRDDEINPLRAGNFGWAPGRSYDESVPMTDTERFSDAIGATWSSGESTIAVSDLAILSDDAWGGWKNRLAVAVLKDKHLRLIQIVDGKVTNEQRLLNDSYGRLRAAVLGPDGSLYLTSDNGNSEDRIIKVTPIRS